MSKNIFGNHGKVNMQSEDSFKEYLEVGYSLKSDEKLLEENQTFKTLKYNYKEKKTNYHKLSKAIYRIIIIAIALLTVMTISLGIIIITMPN